MTPTIPNGTHTEKERGAEDHAVDQRKSRKEMPAGTTATGSAATKKEAKRRGRRERQAIPDNLRFFVGKQGRNQEQPQFEREVASEAEGLVAAFKSDGRLFLVSEYTVVQHIEGGRVTLGKEPAASANQRISTVNAS